MSKKICKNQYPSEFRKWQKGDTADEFFEIMQSDEPAELIESAKASARDDFLADLDQKFIQIDKTEGILEFDSPLNFDEIILLAAHEQARNIKEVRYKSWVTHPRRDSRKYYQKRLEEFEQAHGFVLPQFLLDMISFYDLVVKDGIKDIETPFDDADWELFGRLKLINQGFLNQIISGEINDQNLGLLRDNYHDINYFPLGHWSGNESYTWGVVYDFEERAFTGFLEYLEYAICEGEMSDTYFEGLQVFVDDEIENKRCMDNLSGDYEGEERFRFFIEIWYLQVLMIGFLNQNRIHVPKKEFYRSKKILFDPVENSRGLSEFEEFIYRLLSSQEDSNKDLYNDYKRLKKTTETNGGLGDIFIVEDLINCPSPDSFVNKAKDWIYSFLKNNPWDSLYLARNFLRTQDHNVSNVAIPLLEFVPDDICPVFIKKIARQ